MWFRNVPKITGALYLKKNLMIARCDDQKKCWTHQLLSGSMWWSVNVKQCEEVLFSKSNSRWEQRQFWTTFDIVIKRKQNWQSMSLGGSKIMSWNRDPSLVWYISKDTFQEASHTNYDQNYLFCNLQAMMACMKQ